MNILNALLGMSLVFGATSTSLAGARTDQDEHLVKRICSSPDPVLVIDTFAGNSTNEINIDLDGDGYYDIHHGEFVTKLVELNGQKVIKEIIGTPIFSPEFLDVLNKYIERIEKKELQVSWINFSQGFTVEIDALNSLLGLKNEINAKNVHLYSLRVLETLWASRPKLKIKELYDAFLRLEQLQVPVFVAAANSGFKEVNIYSLFPNVYSVGALDLQGKKASYSADNSTVTIWRAGDLKSYLVAGGIDLNKDQVPDFTTETPFVSPELLEKFQGAKAAQLASKVPPDIAKENDNNKATFFELVAKLPAGLYRTYDLLNMTLATPFQQSRYIKSLGEYFYLDGIIPRPLFFGASNGNGELAISQGQGDLNQQFRNILYGTSFASPNICDGTKTPEEFSL